MIVATIIGLFAAAILLFSGYIFGLWRGGRMRENLQAQLDYFQGEVDRLNVDAGGKINTLLEQGAHSQQLKTQLSDYHEKIDKFSENADKKFSTLIEYSDNLNTVVKPLAEWESQIEKLDDAVREMKKSASVDNKENKLIDLKTSVEHRSNLTELMDEIISKANFESILLSDDQGLPLAGNSEINDLDILAAISAFALIFCDRFTRDGFIAPLSLMTHDPKGREMLFRVFYIENERFVLTSISKGLMLTSNALDPALTKVSDILLSNTLD